MNAPTDENAVRLELLGKLPEDLPPSPGAELVIYLAARPGWRRLEELRAVVPPLAEALAAIKGTRYDRYLEAQGSAFRLRAETDVVAFWQEAYRDLDKVRARYGELAAGFESPIPEFREWLAAEREETLRGLWGTAVGRAAALLDRRQGEEALSLLAEMEAAYPLEPRTALDLADLYWRLGRPADTARVLEAVLDRTDERTRPRAELNLGAALVRSGRVEEGRRYLEALLETEFDERYWALLHLGGLEVLAGAPERALSRAREVREVAEAVGAAELYLMALLLEGEALLRMGRAKEAASGPLALAMGFQEFLGRPFTPVSLALLAEAQALWGKGKKKPLELAEKAYRRAVEARDPYGASRALFAWYLASGDPDKLEAALHQAELAGHAPWAAFLRAWRERGRSGEGPPPRPQG